MSEEFAYTVPSRMLVLSEHGGVGGCSESETFGQLKSHLHTILITIYLIARYKSQCLSVCGYVTWNLKDRPKPTFV